MKPCDVRVMSQSVFFFKKRSKFLQRNMSFRDSFNLTLSVLLSVDGSVEDVGRRVVACDSYEFEVLAIRKTFLLSHYFYCLR